MWHTKRLIVTIGLVVAVSLVASSLNTTASAEEEQPTSVEAVTETLEEVAPAVLDTAAPVPTDNSGPTAIDTTVAGTAITVPTDPAAGITLDAPNAPAINVGLPAATAADNAQVVTQGAVTYDNNNGSTTVPVVKTDGSLSVNITIAGPDAPTSYDFPVTVPGGGTIETTEDGGLVVLDSAGAAVTTIAAPWAKDSTDAAVPTRFEVNGTTVRQIVDHTSVAAVYPVVADPWFLAAIPVIIAAVKWAVAGCASNVAWNLGSALARRAITKAQFNYRVEDAAWDCAWGAVTGGAARFLPWATKMWIRNHVVRMVLPALLRR